MAVKNITKNYPPTLLIHGTDDTDVPYEQSVMMAERLKQHNVFHELISIQNAEHGLKDGNLNEIAHTYESVLSFVDRYMK